MPCPVSVRVVVSFVWNYSQSMDPDRLVSLYERQKRKLDFAETLIPVFERCGDEIGRFRSLREICAWLDANHVQPSRTAKRGSKWHPQRLSDYVYMDGSEPSDEALEASNDRSEGMRVKIRRTFESARFVMEGRPDLQSRWGTVESWEERLKAHDQRVVYVANRLRRALLKT